MDVLQSHILVTTRIEEQLERLSDEARERGVRLIPVVREGTFKVEDVATVFEKAYLASQEHQTILLAADQFSEVVQNKLLKVIEEPPANKSFILIFPSKAAILPTIRSRLPIRVLESSREEIPWEVDMNSLEIRQVYELLQQHQRLSSQESKRFVERLFTEALKSGAYDLDERSYALFDEAIRALDMGSPSSFVLTAVLLKLLAKKKRKKITPKRG